MFGTEEKLHNEIDDLRKLLIKYIAWVQDNNSEDYIEKLKWRLEVNAILPVDFTEGEVYALETYRAMAKEKYNL